MSAAFGRHGDVAAGETDGFGFEYVFLQPCRAPGGEGSRAAISTGHAAQPDPNAPFAHEAGVTDGDVDRAGLGLSHMVLTVDANELVYYVNGAQVGSAPLTFQSLADLSNEVAYLGRSVYDFDGTMRGLIHEFPLYDRAFGESAIAGSFARGFTGAPIPEPVSAVLMLIGSAGLVALRRRRA